MREGFARVDDALIDRLFQPLADWMDRHMALEPQRAARTGIDLASFAWIFSQAGGVAAAAGTHDFPICLARGVLVVLGLGGFTVLRGVFQAGGGNGRVQANPLRPGMQMHRLTCLFWMIGLAVKALVATSEAQSLGLLAVGLLATSAVYLGACTRRPPARREAREPGRRRVFAFGGV